MKKKHKPYIRCLGRGGVRTFCRRGQFGTETITLLPDNKFGRVRPRVEQMLSSGHVFVDAASGLITKPVERNQEMVRLEWDSRERRTDF